MSQDLMQRTCQSFSLPLYALIHDSIVSALKQAQLSQQDTVTLLQSIPKLSLSTKEQNELESAKGAIELEDSFGSGNFFVVDVGSQEALVFTDQQNADHVNRILNKLNGQQQAGSNQQLATQQKDQRQSQSIQRVPQPAPIQAESVQMQTAANATTQIQNNQACDQDLLLKMMVLQQQQQQQPFQQPTLQQIALLDLIKDKDINEFIKLLQLSQIMNQINQSQQGNQEQQGNQYHQNPQPLQPQFRQQKQDGQQAYETGQGQTQGVDLMQMLQELQLMNALQRKK
jgi:hypothetical protein